MAKKYHNFFEVLEGVSPMSGWHKGVYDISMPKNAVAASTMSCGTRHRMLRMASGSETDGNYYKITVGVVRETMKYNEIS